MPARSSTSSRRADLDVVAHRPDIWGSETGARLRRTVEGRPDLRLCLPTGSTPRPLYHAFAGSGGDLSDATVFVLDEFGLPQGSPGRCDVMIADDLVSKLDSPPGRLVTWDTTVDDLDELCTSMEAEAADGGIDLMVLGIGGNGHLGLNEPGTPIDAPARVVRLHDETRQAAARYGAGTTPTWGVTFGMATIMGARRVWLLATGAHKADIIAAALGGPVTSDVPASWLQLHPDVIALLDEEAAAGL